MLKNRKIAVLLLIAILLLSFSTVLANESIDDLKDKKKSTETDMKDKKEELEEIISETKDVSAEIADLDKKTKAARDELSKVEEEIKVLNEDINLCVAEIAEAEENIEDKNHLLNSRLRVMYKNGNIGYLELLFSSNDIKDFLSRISMIQSIAKGDVDLLKFMRENKVIIEENKVELEAKRASVDVARRNLQKREEDLLTATRQKQLFMSELESNKKLAEQELDKLDKLAKSLDSDIRKKVAEAEAKAKANPKPANPPYSGGAMAWPVPSSYRITSNYGYRIHPISGGNRFHSGVDIGASHGSNVVAAADGVVISSGWNGGYGNTVMIYHGNDIVTLYAHNSVLNVREGQQVTKGQVIAKIGSTGMSTGPHLHFEVRKNGGYVNPMPYLRGN